MLPYLPKSADTEVHSLCQYYFDLFKYDIARFRGGADQFQHLIDTLLRRFTIKITGDRGNGLPLGFVANMSVILVDDLGVSSKN